jgi:hypothetical protein
MVFNIILCTQFQSENGCFSSGKFVWSWLIEYCARSFRAKTVVFHQVNLCGGGQHNTVGYLGGRRADVEVMQFMLRANTNQCQRDC